MGRSGHRINHDWRLLTLELVDGADASPLDSVLQLEHLGVVGRNDQDVVEPNRAFDAVAVDP